MIAMEKAVVPYAIAAWTEGSRNHACHASRVPTIRAVTPALPFRPLPFFILRLSFFFSCSATYCMTQTVENFGLLSSLAFIPYWLFLRLQRMR